MPDDPDKTDPMGAAQTPAAGAVVSPGSSGDDDPMTEPQAARLRELCEKTGEPFDASMTRAEADARIEALEEK